MKKILLCLLIASTWVIAIPAQAHTWMTDSNPKKNSKVEVVPEKIWIEFAEDLLVLEGQKINQIVVTDSSGAEVDKKDSVVGGARVTVSVKDTIQDGLIKISYRIAAGDGHVLSDSFTFTLSTNRAVSVTTKGPAKEEGKSTLKPSTQKNQTQEPSPTASPELKSKFPQSSAHQEHEKSFLGRHSVHFVEGVVALSIIFLWAAYRRFDLQNSK